MTEILLIASLAANLVLLDWMWQARKLIRKQDAYLRAEADR